MKIFTYIGLALLACNSLLLAQKPSFVDNEKYKKVIILEKGVKRTILVPKDDTVKNKMNSTRVEQAKSKDGLIVSFKDPSTMSISAFESKYNLKLKHRLRIGYYIFINTSLLTDLQIVEEITTNETNIETVKPNWRTTNTIR